MQDKQATERNPVSERRRRRRKKKKNGEGEGEGGGKGRGEEEGEEERRRSPMETLKQPRLLPRPLVILHKPFATPT